jgi:hypothetical protein
MNPECLADAELADLIRRCLAVACEAEEELSRRGCEVRYYEAAKRTTVMPRGVRVTRLTEL